MSAPTTDRPVSAAQRGIWLTERLRELGTAFHMPLGITLSGPLDRQALLDACARLVDRHPILAAAFTERDGEPRLVPAAVRPPITVGDAAPELNLETGPLAAFTLVPLGPEEHRLSFVAHHLVFDGLSKDVLVRDLAALYAGEELPPLADPEPDTDRIEAALPEAKNLWASRWHDVPEVILDGRKMSTVDAEPGGAVELRLDLPRLPDLTRFEVLLAAVHALLHGYGNTPTAVSVDASTRGPDESGHIGLFVNELPVFATADPGTSFAEFAAAIRAEFRTLNSVRHVPVARAAGRVSPRAALTPVSISYRRRAAEPVFPGLDAKVDWMMSAGAVRGVLHVQAVDGPDGLEVLLRHNSRVLDRAAAERIGEHLRAIVEADPSLPLTGPAETPVAEQVQATAVAPSEVDDELVGQVKAIWTEVLRIPDIGPDEDLYDLGGHSLTITQITARIRKRLGVEVPFDVFLEEPTVLGVAAAVRDLRP